MKRKIIAALGLCLAAALAFTGCGSSGTAETAGKVPSQSEVSIANGIVACDGHAALAEKLGFDVAQPDYLPFDAYSTEYYSYWDEITTAKTAPLHSARRAAATTSPATTITTQMS